MEIDGVEVTVSGGDVSESEIRAYIKRGETQYKDKKIIGIEIKPDGEYADIKYYFDSVPFERIRRITGYLVGTLDRFNNAKRAEVSERVKHGV